MLGQPRLEQTKHAPLDEGPHDPLPACPPTSPFLKPCKLASKHMSLETQHASAVLANGGRCAPSNPPAFRRGCAHPNPLGFLKTVQACFKAYDPQHMSLFETQALCLQMGGLHPAPTPSHPRVKAVQACFKAYERLNPMMRALCLQTRGGGGGGGAPNPKLCKLVSKIPTKSSMKSEENTEGMQVFLGKTRHGPNPMKIWTEWGLS